ncbi:MAG TPA: hypothetical protein VF848_08000, partial [Steroidobacteraceae bacterium]
MRSSRAASNAQNHSPPRRINSPEIDAKHAAFRQSQLLNNQQNTLRSRHFRIVHGRLTIPLLNRPSTTGTVDASGALPASSPNITGQTRIY